MIMIVTKMQTRIQQIRKYKYDESHSLKKKTIENRTMKH